MEPTVTITRRGADRLAAGHPWIYRGDVDRAPAGLRGGEVVAMKDGRGRFLGKAFWSARSKIALRTLTREDVPVDEEFFAERLASAVALREAAFPGEPSVRLVHGEADLLPGLVIDRFGDVAVLQTLVPGTETRKQLLVDLLWDRLRLRSVVERNDVRVRELEGLPQVKGVLRGEEPGALEYREGAARMRLDVLGGQKTGAFLDQRENRLRAGAYARGKCLDCFSYAGAFALQLAGRAEHVTAVELQAPAAAQLRDNVALNGLQNVEVAEANAFDFLRDASEREPEYDLVVLDPPAFAKNKDALPAARRGYKEINLRAMQILKPGGILVTASCSYHMSEALLEEVVLDAARDAGRPAQLLEKRGAGRDHPVLMGVPETHYLKCFVVRLP
ncbi:class I SAM-dependent rRNA methyltransferase [Anaeromyxobacter diazotrophicus]|uniref:SAM-dependent methyltransferase n=1 Tax=Anaeromyxobacter diazotrophicus TaxID=2590199 RepID=A0A7I9VK91_9BACT|nr:class I SAM-dependent rRNA methyltransferase [Anaeromyxobacter diazotrophicus]GEJ56824.1 SAM-dependent methyltransferase [Anaeromyxobacter diazotrophicus]